MKIINFLTLALFVFVSSYSYSQGLLTTNKELEEGNNGDCPQCMTVTFTFESRSLANPNILATASGGQVQEISSISRIAVMNEGAVNTYINEFTVKVCCVCTSEEPSCPNTLSVSVEGVGYVNVSTHELCCERGPGPNVDGYGMIQGTEDDTSICSAGSQVDTKAKICSMPKSQTDQP